MTDLQASLMAIGGAILAGVVSYNKWQEYKAKKSVERAFSSTHDDVLMKREEMVQPEYDLRYEPTLEIEVTADIAEAGLLDGMAEHGKAIVFSTPAPQKELPVDELIDCVISLFFAGPLRAEKILHSIQGLRHVGNKPVRFIGQREDGSWDSIMHGYSYLVLRAGVQLASRTGVLNEIEYSELVTRLRQVAEELDAEPDVPDMKDVMITAREMHQFVAEYDMQLSVNVLSKGAPWAISTLLVALERQGFDLHPDGRLVMANGDGGILFSLSTNVTLAAETTTKLTLLLHVPCVAQSRDGFRAMTACAKMLAARLDGIVVDDSNQALSDAALEQIAVQVTSFYAHMQEANVPAGSVRALRLFG